MNIWLSENFYSNKKIRRLIRELGSDAVISLHKLWFYAAQYAVDNLLDEDKVGILKDFDDLDIEANAEWKKEDGKFVELLISLKLLTKKYNHYFIHDFADNNPQIVVLIKQKIAGSKYARKRWEGKQLGDSIGDPIGDLIAKEKKRKEKKVINPSAEVCEEIINYLNQKTGRAFETDNEDHHRYIRLRWKKYPDVEKFKYVIDVCCQKWCDDEKMKDFLQPSTLFNGKFVEKLGWSKVSEVDHRTPAEIVQAMSDEKARLAREQAR